MGMKTYRRKRGNFKGALTSSNNFKLGSTVILIIEGRPGVEDTETFTLTENWTPEIAKSYLLTMLVQAEQRFRDGAALIPSATNPASRRARAKTKRKPAKKKTKKKATRRRNPSAKPADTRMRREYRATYITTRGRARARTINFWALGDDAAKSYALGLLSNRLPKGASVTRLEATGKTRRGPVKVAKKLRAQKKKK